MSVLRQTYNFSIDFQKLLAQGTSTVSYYVSNLKFAADTMILKNITYNSREADPDTDDVVQIWCSKAENGLIGYFQVK